MGTYFVIGGIFPDLNGNERFTLVCSGPGEQPYIMLDGNIFYFKLIWQDAHIYQVEEDYTLALVAASPDALQKGIKAPAIITPDTDLRKKLLAVIRPS